MSSERVKKEEIRFAPREDFSHHSSWAGCSAAAMEFSCIQHHPFLWGSLLAVSFLVMVAYIVNRKLTRVVFGVFYSFSLACCVALPS